MYRISARPRPLAALVSIVSLGGTIGTATAGGFLLSEHGASGMGNSYAGAAAVSTDTSTIWFNPAGMSQLEGRQTSLALHFLSTTSDWTDEGTSLGAAVGGGLASGPDSSDPGTNGVLPNFYYVSDINDQWSYGLGIGIPFGSSTDYDDDWKGRYTTIESSISVIDFNPAISFKMSDKVSLGFGVSVQYLSADLTSAVDSGAACLGLAANPGTSFTSGDCLNAGLTPGVQANDGTGEINGDSTALSFNVGALFTPAEGVKIGVAYRHSVDHELEGDVDFTVDPGLQAVLDSNTIAAGQALTQGFLTDVDAEAAVDLPATFMVSGAWQMNNKIQWLADVTWTGWSSFEELRVEFDNPFQGDTLSVQDWEDVFRYSAGINYTVNNKLTLRAGVAFDEEAIPSAERRTARIPGDDRTWVSIGAGYKVNKNFSFDIGAAHLSLSETAIDNSDPESEGVGQVVRGIYDGNVNFVSAQVNWAFN